MCGVYRISFFKKMLIEGHKVIGVDNLNNYYDINLKKARIEELKKYVLNFHLILFLRRLV